MDGNQISPEKGGNYEVMTRVGGDPWWVHPSNKDLPLAFRYNLEHDRGPGADLSKVSLKMKYQVDDSLLYIYKRDL